jgi:hypothetical protein
MLKEGKIVEVESLSDFLHITIIKLHKMIMPIGMIISLFLSPRSYSTMLNFHPTHYSIFTPATLLPDPPRNMVYKYTICDPDRGSDLDKDS